MPTVAQSELPRPKSWDEFEDIVWDLYARIWNDPNAQRYGRSGQAQQGIDIYGQPSHLMGGYAGVQCKLCESGKLTQAVIEAEISKAESFVPPLGEYTIATTHPRDATVQRIIRDINEERTKKGQFPIHIVFWEDICSRLSHPDKRDLLQKHYGDWLPADFAMRPTLTVEECRELERAYLKRVAGECRHLRTEGVDNVRAELKDVFVMLEAVQSPRSEERIDVAPVPRRAEEMGLLERLTDRRALRKDKRAEQSQPPPPPPPPPAPLSKALAEHKRLIILGEPGTGKSTILQFVALCFAQAEQGWVGQRLGLGEDRVPVRIELRQYDGQERLDRFLVHWLDTRYYVPEWLAQGWLDEGRLAILLDGLDEVPQEHCSDVVRALEGFAASAEGRVCRIVVCSRISGYQRTRELDGNFGHYTICPFSGPEDALPYTAGWLQLFREMTDEEAEAEARALLEEMEGQAGLRRVRGNALLLRLIVAIYAESGELARNRAEVYRRYVEEVVWQRAETREQARWSRETIEAAVEAIAWTLQSHGEQTKGNLANAAAEAVEGLADARHLIDYLQEQLGLLAVYGYEQGELIAFRHLTFREYFVARRLARTWAQAEYRENSWHYLRPRLHHPAWQEPILLMAGMVSSTQSAAFVQRVMKARSSYQRVLHCDLLLASAIAGDGVPLDIETFKSIATRLLTLFSETERRWWHQSKNLVILFVLATAGFLLFITKVIARLPHWFSRITAWAAQLPDRLNPYDWAALGLLLLFLMLIVIIMLKAMIALTLSALDTGLARLGPVGARGRYSLLQKQIDDALVAMGMLNPQLIGESLCSNFSKRPVALWPRASAIANKIGWVRPEVLSLLIRAFEVPELQNVRQTWEKTGKSFKALFRLSLHDPSAMILAAQQWWRTQQGYRQKATEALGYLAEGRPEILAKLTDALKDEYGGTRWAAGQTMARANIVTESMTAALLEGLGQSSQMVVKPHFFRPVTHPEPVGATLILAQFSQAAPGKTLSVLLGALRDEDLQIRLIALQALAKWQDGRVGPNADEVASTLFHLLETGIDQDSGYVTKMLKEGGFQPQQVEYAALQKAFDQFLYSFIVEALGKWGVSREVSDALLQVANDQSVRNHVIEILKKRGVCEREDLDDCLWVLNKPTPADYVVKTLANRTSDNQKALIVASFIARASSELRTTLLETLVRTGVHSSETVSFAVAMLEHASWEYLDRVALALLQLGAVTPEVMVALAARFRDKSYESIVYSFPHAHRLDLLFEVLGSSFGYLRRSAVWSAAATFAELGRNSANEAISILLNALIEGDEYTQEAVAWTLGEMGVSTPQVVEALSDLLKPGFFCFSEAARTYWTSSETAMRTNQRYLVQLSISEALCKLGRTAPRNVDALIEVARHNASHNKRRIAAIKAIITLRVKNRKVVKTLLILLLHRDRETRVAAANALEKLGASDRQIATTLLSGMRDSGGGSAAADMAGYLAHSFSWETTRQIAFGLHRLLAGTKDEVANTVFQALDRLVTRLTELEVEAVGDGPPLFATTSPRPRLSPAFLAALGILIATLSGLASNVLAAYLQEQYALLTDPARIAIVAAVFMLTLAGSIWIALRSEKRAA